MVERVRAAKEVLRALGFAARQSNDTAALTLLALANLPPEVPWGEASNPLRGITPIIDWLKAAYGKRFAPNTRETIRDECVKHFELLGLLIRNPDDPARPTTSGKTVYQIEPLALELLRTFGTAAWSSRLRSYLKARSSVRREIERGRTLAQVPVKLPGGRSISLSPGGQNPLIKAVVDEFCARFAPGATVLYVGDAEGKFKHFEGAELARLGVKIDSAAMMPDVVVYDARRNWLLLVEAVASDGPVDGKRRAELKRLFSPCTAGLVFVTAFSTRAAMQSFLTRVSWESEVWVADEPDHLIHFDGERFLGPYPDVERPKRA